MSIVLRVNDRPAVCRSRVGDSWAGACTTCSGARASPLLETTFRVATTGRTSPAPRRAASEVPSRRPRGSSPAAGPAMARRLGPALWRARAAGLGVAAERCGCSRIATSCATQRADSIAVDRSGLFQDPAAASAPTEKEPETEMAKHIKALIKAGRPRPPPHEQASSAANNSLRGQRL